jgi:hypothetical protein
VVLNRLPWRISLGVHAALAVMTAIYVAMSLSTDGPGALGAWLVTGALLALWACWGWVTFGPRRPVPPGTTSVTGSRPVAGLLGATVALVVAGAVVWGVLLATDPASLPNPGFVLILVVGALGSLPTLARAATGRLHLWRVDAGPEGVRYRGGRVDRALPWSAVGSVHLNALHTRLVLTPTDPDAAAVEVPMLAFDVDPAALRDAVEQARSQREG